MDLAWQIYGLLYLALVICGSLFSPFVFVIFLWVLQKHFPKVRILYLCSIVSFIIISVTDIVNWLNNFFFRNEFLFDVVIKILSPGSLLAKPFSRTFEPTLIFVVLAMVFSEIFYTVVLFGVVAIVSHVKGKCLCRKSD